MKSYLIKVYHSIAQEKTNLVSFFKNIGHILHDDVVFALNYARGETFYTVHAEDTTHQAFEGVFYAEFPDFQMVEDGKKLTPFDVSRTSVGHIGLENGWFFPYREDVTDFIANIFRGFDTLDPTMDRVSYQIRIRPIHADNIGFYFRAKWDFWLLKVRLAFSFFRYMFNFKTKNDWKKEGKEFFEKKIRHELFRTEISIIVESRSKSLAESRVKALFQNFSVFQNFPLNTFKLSLGSFSGTGTLAPSHSNVLFLSGEELALLFQFPKNPKLETTLLKVSGRRLAPPIGAPIMEYDFDAVGNIVTKPLSDMNLTPIGVSDFRSIRVPIGTYDEDRLRHLYVIGQTGVGKSKFLINMMIADITKGKGICMIDPHGDTFEEVIMHIPPSRKDDVIIFDPTDEKYPFCFNPLDIRSTESKQILAKGFIDIFKKFF